MPFRGLRIKSKIYAVLISTTRPGLRGQPSGVGRHIHRLEWQAGHRRKPAAGKYIKPEETRTRRYSPDLL